MGSNAPMGKSKAVSSHRSPRRTKRVIGRRFVRGRAVRETKRWRNPKRCPATAIQERRIRNLTRRRERLGIAQVLQLPKMFCGREGVLECSGLTELWMGSSAPMGKSKAVSSHRSPRNKEPESHAETRWVGDRVPQLSKTFCGHEGVLECSGLTELGMESSAPMGKIQSGVQPPHCKKPGSGRNFLIQISNFRFLHSFPAPKPLTLESRL
jgi:hypothetical protein